MATTHDTDTETLHAPELGEPGTPCEHCGAALAADQRYCLNCGLRRAEARLPFREILAERAAVQPPPTGPVAAGTPVPGGGGLNPLTAAVGVLAVALLLGVGLVIGLWAQDDEPARPPVVNVTGGGGAGPATKAAFSEDWPPGKEGFTVQLQVLPKAGTQPAAIAAAKAAATAKGAQEVGALDSDQHTSLDAGSYVVYSGVYDTKKEADAALKPLKVKFPQAQVVEVSAAGAAGSGTGTEKADASAPDTGSAKKASKKELQDLQSSSGKDYAKKSKKLPDKLATEGKPPPKDNKAPGAGSEGTTIP